MSNTIDDILKKAGISCGIIADTIGCSLWILEIFGDQHAGSIAHIKEIQNKLTALNAELAGIPAEIWEEYQVFVRSRTPKE